MLPIKNIHVTSLFKLRFLPVALSLIFTVQIQGQLVINEFSQGASGSKEYIELIVTGTKTCTDSTADLRGWIIDDQNGWYGGLERGISTGHFRFALVPNWEKVPYGSIILLYNNADKNSSIAMPDDPADTNKDNVYIIPHTSTFMEVHNAQPASPSSPQFNYPQTGYSTPDMNDWSMRMGLNNALDAVVVVHPSQRALAHFSITYGLQINAPFQTPTINLDTPVDADQNCYLSNDKYANAESWLIGTAPQNETPGMPNTPADAVWIASMRAPPPQIPITNITACIAKGQSFTFNGQSVTTSGNYTTVYKSLAQCDSVVRLHLVVSATQTQTIAGCGFVLFNGTIYTSSNIIRDTVKSFISGCDSLYFITTIQVYNKPEITVSPDITICKGAQTSLTATAPNATINWLNADTGNSIIVKPIISTIYTAIATDLNGCSDTENVQVNVEDFNLTLSASANPVSIGNTVVLQTGAAVPYQVLSWNPAAIFLNRTEKRQLITPQNFLNIIVIAKTDAGCIDTAFLQLRVIPNGLHVPTAFTPNKDGKNDVLRVLGTGIEKFDFKLFNRWGQMVFNTTNPAQGWDGYYKGMLQPVGAYVYSLLALMHNGTKENKKGTIMLLY